MKENHIECEIIRKAVAAYLNDETSIREALNAIRESGASTRDIELGRQAIDYTLRVKKLLRFQ